MQSTQTLDEIFDRACSTIAYREPMMEPHLDGDHVFATNGHVLLRAPASMLEGEYESRESYPNCDRLLPSEGLDFSVVEREALRRAILAVPTTTIYPEAECPECYGDGDQECPCCGAMTSSCGYCDGTGTVTDLDAPGEAAPSPGWNVQVFGGHFDPKYLSILCDVADCAQADILWRVAERHKRYPMIHGWIGHVGFAIMPKRVDVEEHSVSLEEVAA